MTKQTHEGPVVDYSADSKNAFLQVNVFPDH